MLLSDAVVDYLQYLSAERGVTKDTLRTYGPALNRFRGWLAAQNHGDPEVRSLDVALCRKYAYSLDAEGLRPRTRRGYLIPLRCLYQFLFELGAVETNPWLSVKLPKKDAAIRLLVNEEQCRALYEAAGRQANLVKAARDQAIFASMLFCALRRQELLHLNVEDVDCREGFLLVRSGKGQKPRTVWFCEEAKAAFTRWVQLRPPCKSNGLFTVDSARRLGEKGLTEIIDRVKAAAGYAGSKAICGHSLRHAAATRWARNGVDLTAIKELLGHTNIKQTAIYLHSDEEHAQQAAPLLGFRPQKEETPTPPPMVRPHGDAYFQQRRHSVRRVSRQAGASR